MEKKLLVGIGILLVAVVLISGCIQETESTYPAIPIEYNFYGKVLDYSLQDESIALKVEASIVNCELKTETKEITATYDSEYINAYSDVNISQLAVGKNYVMQLTKDSKTDTWFLNGASENLVKYKEDVCKAVHENDLKINQLTNVETYNESDPQAATKIIPTVINIGEETEIAIELQNYQDNDITYKILHAEIRSEFLTSESIDSCQVIFDGNENIIERRESNLIPYTTQLITFNVLCNEPIKREITYESCDINGENCSMVTVSNQFILWGEIEFTDELGNKHIMPEQRILKQFIEIE